MSFRWSTSLSRVQIRKRYEVLARSKTLGGSMRFLLTSAGVKNASIRDALVDLLGKPIAEASALCIPTAAYGHPMVGPGAGPWRFIAGRSDNPMCELGWKSLGVLELTALPTIDEERWVPCVRETDVLLVAGGDAVYLCHWMRQSGLGGPASVAERDGLGGTERREHGDDPEDRGGLRPVETADRRRQHAGHRRLLDLPTPGSGGPAGQL